MILDCQFDIEFITMRMDDDYKDKLVTKMEAQITYGLDTN